MIIQDDWFEVFSYVLDWERNAQVSARAKVGEAASIREWDIDVIPRTGQWQMREQITGERRSGVRGKSVRTEFADGRVEETVGSVQGIHFALLPCFPLRARIWGRSGDQYRPVDVLSEDSGWVVTLQPIEPFARQNVHALESKYFVSREHKMITSLQLGGRSVALTAVRAQGPLI